MVAFLASRRKKTNFTPWSPLQIFWKIPLVAPLEKILLTPMVRVRLRVYLKCLGLLQPLRWHCVECVTHHKRDVRKEQQYVYMAWTSNNRVIMACELYCCSLPQYEALRTCCSSFSDRNKMVLWPGCGGRAIWSLHKKNVQSVWFVVKRRGCCWNLSGGLCGMCDSPQTGCARRTICIRGANKQ